jgi:uncharacterized protein YfcZ (UPF0381/DUF406 family)
MINSGDMQQDSDETKLKALFEKLGSTKEQAERMVPQLIKRARQMADEKGISYFESLDYLIRLTIGGRSGSVDIHGPKSE